MDQKFMKKHKAETNLDGDWNGFFKMLRASIDGKSWSLAADEDGELTL